MKTALLLVALAGCTTEVVDPAYTGHTEDPWLELERTQREGTTRYASRVHGCPKMRIATTGNVLVPRAADRASPLVE